MTMYQIKYIKGRKKYSKKWVNGITAQKRVEDGLVEVVSDNAHELDESRCAGKTKKGTRCKMPATVGPYCKNHAPEEDE